MVVSSNGILDISANLKNAILSRELVELALLFFNDVEEHEFPLTL